MPLPDGFVHLDTVDPTIVPALRYAGEENVLGRPVPGYLANRPICTRICAEKLRRINARLRADGFALVVYDAYRPQKAVDAFLAWSLTNDTTTAPKYYPDFIETKPLLFERSYFAKYSNHVRGSTVDVTIVRLEARGRIAWQHALPLQMRDLHAIAAKERIDRGKEEEEEGVECRQPSSAAAAADADANARLLPYLDDGSVDMGTSFDLLGPPSHPDAPPQLIPPAPFAARRRYLHDAMAAEGFVVSPREWWHFWLKEEEPFRRNEADPALSPSFDFNVE